MSELRELFETSPLFLFAVVSAFGALLGSVRVAGVSLGVAAVLFVGLAVNAIVPSAKLPEVLQQFGLVLFVYTIGLASAPGLRSALRTRGLRDFSATCLLVFLSASAATALAVFVPMPATRAAGLYAGAVTNTPALAEVVQYLREHAREGAGALVAEPVVAYSVAYPFGVLGALVGAFVALRVGAGSGAAGSASRREDEPQRDVALGVVKVTNPAFFGQTMRDVRKGIDKPFTFARHVREGHQTLAMDDLRLAEGDLLTLVGAPEAVAEVTELLGEPSSTHLELDRSVLDFRRMTVSRREVVGIPLAQLALPQRLGGRITRVRRGDVDFVPTDDTRLEPGDRVRVIAPRERIAELTKFFGDSIRAISEVDMLPFGLGIAIGIAIGHVDIPLPFGLSFRLGMAGGPLVVGLVLGAVVRTGPLVWVLPGSANLTLRQFGLILFFATVGTRAGAEFFRVVTTPDGLVLASLGAGLTAGTAALTLVVGRKLLGLSSAALAGFLAGVHTQPAALTFAHERSGSERVAVHYAMVFPVATVAKILAVQVLLRVLGAA